MTETGFFPKSANHNQVLSKKPGFSPFVQTYARLDKETGFFPKSANHNQVLSKKPGFSAFVQTYARLDKETGFFPKSANHSIQGKNPVSGHPRVQD